MAKVTWKGEGEDGSKQTTGWGKTFKVGEAVEIDDPAIIEKAKGNPYFEVSEGAPKATQTPAPQGVAPAATINKSKI